MGNTKWWLNSMTIRGVLLTLVPAIVSILKLAGIEVPDDSAQTIIEGISGFVGAVGAIIAIAGRVTAEVSLRLKK